MIRIIATLFISIFIAACGPDYPNDANHAGVSNGDCRDCHVDGINEDAPKPPGNHFDGSRLKWDKCTRCHNQQ